MMTKRRVQFRSDFLPETIRFLSVPSQARSIADVAAECGFADQTHLGRRFRLAYGISPLEFRQEQQKAQAESKRAQAHTRRSRMAD